MLDLNVSKDSRLDAIKKWLHTELLFSDFEITVASADASFRRYFRLKSSNKTWVIMDAPPEKEDCTSFVKIAQLLESVGVQSPHIYNFNAEQGFMQLSDLGSTAYLDVLAQDTVDALYENAIDSIVRMQIIDAGLPLYNESLLMTEMSLFTDWYLAQNLKIELSEKQQRVIANTFSRLSGTALEQQQVFVHRDFHSRNLMVVDNNNSGVIDFQDAVSGACSYDLVSLIKDCYIAWPREKQLQWIDYYLAKSKIKINKKTFIKNLDLMGLQRHLKAIGIFSRLNYRDAKPGYLNDIPRTMAYVLDVCQRYDELADFYCVLKECNVDVDHSTLALIK